MGPSPERFYIFEAPGLHFWRSLKQIRKRIGCQVIVFYKNGYISQNSDFITPSPCNPYSKI